MNKTQKLKNIILSKYSSIREFSRIVNIPSTTLTSALDKDIGGMAVDRIIKICDALNIDIKTFEPINNIEQINTLSKEEKVHIEDLRKLNDLGKKKVITYTQDLLDNPKFATTNDETCASLVEEDSSPYLVACHDDDLSDEEKNTMNNKINEFLNK